MGWARSTQKFSKFSLTILLFLVLAFVCAIPLASARVGHITALTVEDQNDSVGRTADISLEIRPGRGAIRRLSRPIGICREPG